jgi:hypothetical protein
LIYPLILELKDEMNMNTNEEFLGIKELHKAVI